MQIRPATEDDWPAIFPIWHSIVAAGETYAYPTGVDSDTARDLWMEPEPWHVVVAVDDDGTVLGTAKCGPNRPARGAHIATASFMVSPGAQGRGVGRALGEYIIEWARNAGFHGMQFNAVVETNTAALALWRALGFDVVGTVPEAFDHPSQGLVGLHVMYRRL